MRNQPVCLLVEEHLKHCFNLAQPLMCFNTTVRVLIHSSTYVICSLLLTLWIWFAFEEMHVYCADTKLRENAFMPLLNSADFKTLLKTHFFSVATCLGYINSYVNYI